MKYDKPFAILVGSSSIIIAMILTAPTKIHEPIKEQIEPPKVIKECLINSLSYLLGDLPLSVRNNNPINIKNLKINEWIGEDSENKGKFERFLRPEDGIKASIKVIKANIKATDSVRQFAKRISVEGEGLTKHLNRYTYYMEKQLGYKGKIKMQDASKVLEIMVLLEGGVVADSYFNKYYNCKG